MAPPSWAGTEVGKWRSARGMSRSPLLRLRTEVDHIRGLTVQRAMRAAGVVKGKYRVRPCWASATEA